MSANTTRLSLYKPGGGSTGIIVPDEIADIDKINGNMDIIDAAAGFYICTSTTHPAVPFPGQPIYETDTRNSLYWSASTSRYVPIGTPNAASDALRDALFPVPQAGNRVFRTDKGYEQRYTGTAWVGAGGDSVLITPTSVTGTLPAVANATILSSGRVSFAGMTKLFLNGVFSADFESYEIEVEIDSMAGDTLLLFGLALAGVQAAGATDYNYTRASAVGAAWTVTNSGAGSSTFNVGRCSAVDGGIAKFTLARPALAKKTRFLADSIDMAATREVAGGYHNLATAYDGLVFTPATTNINGWITVKGNPL